MRVDIQARGLDLTQGLRAHTERSLQFAFSWEHYRVTTIYVLLSDINGPRGGNDKSCHIRIPLSGLQEVVIEDVASNLFVAIDRAAGRAGRTAARQLRRLHTQHPAAPSIKYSTVVESTPQATPDV